MLAELLPALPLIISACYHFPKASGGFKYLGDGAVYERPLRPLKTGLLGSWKRRQEVLLRLQIYTGIAPMWLLTTCIFLVLNSQKSV